MDVEQDSARGHCDGDPDGKPGEHGYGRRDRVSGEQQCRARVERRCGRGVTAGKRWAEPAAAGRTAAGLGSRAP